MALSSVSCSIVALFTALSFCAAARADTMPPLLSAVKHQNVTIVRRLLNHGARVDARDSYGYTALFWAAVTNQLVLAKLLVARGANVNAAASDGDTPIFAAAVGATLPMVDFLIAHGADVNTREVPTRKTALYYAAQYASVGVVHALVRHGASVDAATNNFERPLTIAAQQKRAAVVAELLKDGADGGYALTWETYYNRIDSVRILLDAGVNVNARFENAGFGPHSGTTALIEAASGNSMPLAELLLSRGADPNLAVPSDENMTTALMFAAYNCNADMIRLLASHGVLDRTRANGRNAYDLANSGSTNNMEPCDSTILTLLSEMQ